MLPPGELSVEHADVDGRHLLGFVVIRRSQILRTQKFENGSGGDRGHVAALVIEPSGVAFFRHAITNEGGTRRAQRDQLMSVNGNIASVLAAERGFSSAVLH